MRFGIGIVPQNNNIDDIVNSIKLAEEAGFEYAWIGDAPNDSLFKILKCVGMETETINIGPGVTNPYIRKPEYSASEMINLNELLNNRTTFGIGPGNKDMANQLMIPWTHPFDTLKDSVNTIRKSFENKNAKIPIYVGCQSPKLLELTGSIGDGVLINASHPKDYEELIENIEKGLENNKNKINFDIGAYAATSIGADKESAVNAAKIVVAFIIAGSTPLILERHKIGHKLAEEIQINLLKGNIGGAVNLVNNDLLDIFSVTGTHDEIISKIKDLKKVGVSQFIAGAPIGQNMNESITLFGDVISSF